MNLPDVVSREEWNAARDALLIKEKELTRARDQLSAERRRLPMVRIEKQYLFDGPDGPVMLHEIFEGRQQLIVYHFMFGPEWDEGCPSCSFLVDGIGNPVHLHVANTTIALVSRAPYTKLDAYKRRMGWSIPWYSSFGTDFNYDFNVTFGGAEGQGLSVFLRDGESVFHTYSTYARGCDHLLSTFNYLDLTPLGRQEHDGTMNWVRRHDEYQFAPQLARTAY